MGGAESQLPTDKLAEFERTSFFTKNEIKHLFQRFMDMGGSLAKPISADAVLSMPELQSNPFRFRICQVFGEADEARGADNKHQRKHHDEAREHKDAELLLDNVAHKYWFTFVRFLHMFNAFSPHSSLQIKAYYAFKLYDFDEDKFLNTEDIVQVVALTVGKGRMGRRQLLEIASEVLAEADLDGNHKLSRTEFNRVCKRLPDFATKFQFSIQ